MYSENTVMRLNDIAHRYKDIVYQAIYSVISQPPYKNTGEGAASLTIDVIDGTRDKAPELVINFADHLNYINKKKLQWTKLPKMEGLLKWAETKKSTKQEAEQLAWATAWDKKKNDTWKGMPWRKKTLSQVLKEMNEMVLKAFDEAIEQDFDAATKVK